MTFCVTLGRKKVNLMRPDTHENHQEDINIDEEHHLILLNDEFNTVDFVIDALIEICDHDFEQAYQCTLIAHHKGKCDIKSGSVEYLRPLKGELLNRGLGATIE